MPDAFDAALRDIFGDPDGSKAATYTPTGGAAQSLRVVPFNPQQAVSSGLAEFKVVTTRAGAEILVADMPVKPVAGALLAVDGQPVRKIAESTLDARGRKWMVVLVNV